MTYLITGATGTVGSLVVEGLLSRGERPRIFVRDAAKAQARYGNRVDITVGDLADVSSLAAALRGVDALFLVNMGPHLEERDGAAAAAAKAAGVRLLVKLSSMDAQQSVGTGAWHGRGESAISRTGIACSFVQPAGFMSNALGWAKSIKEDGVFRAPTGDGRIPFIHPEDIAGVAVEALTTQAYAGLALPISGPDALSYSEMAAKIGEAIGKPVRFQPCTDEEERHQMLADGEPEPLVDAHLSIYRAIREGRLARVTDTVERVLGRKPIAFDRWVRDNAAAFRS